MIGFYEIYISDFWSTEIQYLGVDELLKVFTQKFTD